MSRFRDRGQAAVELALALPLLCLLAAGLLQVALVARHQLAVQEAARRGARAAAVAAAPAAAAQQAAAAAVGIAPLVVTAAPGAGGTVTVTVRYVDRTDAPLIGWLLPDLTLTASATMVVEPP